MNWTEGTLARHSRRKGWDKDAARQKQYFAKARARKNAPSSSKGLDVVSFVPDYIQQPQQSQDRHSASSTPAKKQKTPKRKLIHKQYDANKTPRRDLVQGINLELPKPDGETQHSPARHSNKDYQELDIAAKRRKLLERVDWTGVSTQKPLMVNPAWQKDPSPRQPRTSNSRQDPRSLRKMYEWDRNCHSNERTLGRLSDNEMRINIGSQNLRWSRESNSVRSFPTRQSITAHPESSPASSLKWGPISPYQRPPSAQAPIRATTRLRNSNKSPGHLDFRSQLSNPTDSALNTAYGQEGCDEPRFVVKAHTPIIYQPQPTRETRPPMFNIRSPEVDENMSTTAVLGASRRPSDRITSEDIRWNAWLSSNAITARKEPAQTNDTREPSRSVSPGISQFWTPSEEHSQTPSPLQYGSPRQRALNQFDEPQLQSFETTPSNIPLSDSAQSDMPNFEPEVSEVHEEDGSAAPTTLETRNSHQDPNHDKGESYIQPRSNWVLSSGTSQLKATNARDLLELLAESEDRNGATIEKQVGQKATPNAEDEDEIWKRFVFDSDTVETTRRAREEANEQTKRDLGLKKTNELHTFEDPLLASSSTAPRSDVAEPPSASRDQSLSMKQTFDIANDQIGKPLGTDHGLDLDEQPSSEAAAKTDTADTADTIDSIVAQPSSPEPTQAEFKFYQPQLFIGRLAGEVPSNTPSVSWYAPKKGRRWRKRRDKGRPDFRVMPDYDDDPIEED